MTTTDIRNDASAVSPIIELSGVLRGFGTVRALDDFDLRVQPGTVCVLVGPNGAGKTTALRVITGALRPHRGWVRVFGLDPAGSDGSFVRRKCGVVAAKPALYDRLTGADNLLYSAELYGLGRHVDVHAAADRFGIAHALDKRVGGYSTGMKTRLALTRAVLHDPEVLLLDEPTSGLDPESSQAVLKLIDEMAAGGRTVVMCTHLLLEAEGLADHVVLVQDGKSSVSGEPDTLVREYWPFPDVLIVGEGDSLMRVANDQPGVRSVVAERGGVRLELETLDIVPDLVASMVAAGVRVSRVVPHEPTLEELYLKVRGLTAIPPSELSGESP